MPFTAAEQRLLLQRAAARRRNAGSGLNITKAQLANAFDAILATWQSAAYRTAQSAAIDAAVAGLSNAEKRAIHELAAEMASSPGYF